MLALLDLCDAVANDAPLDTRNSARRVVGVDVDIRAHNRAAIEAHPLSSYITMLEGSSVDEDIVQQVYKIVGDSSPTLVCLDSNHTHDHVLAELMAYTPLVTPDSYCVVFDTVVEDMGENMYPDRPWGPGDNPKTAVWEFLQSNSGFAVDSSIHDRLQITMAPDGFLRRIR